MTQLEKAREEIRKAQHMAQLKQWRKEFIWCCFALLVPIIGDLCYFLSKRQEHALKCE